jgi:hypothetical protein
MAETTAQFIKRLQTMGIVGTDKATQQKADTYLKNEKSSGTKTTTPVAAPAPVATSNTYNYVDSSGNVRQVSASSADEAMRKASNIGANSGVQLVSGGSSAPAPVTTTPGQTAVTSPTTSPTTTTSSNVSNMTPTDFVQYLVSTGTIKAEDAARATSIATGQPDPTMMANIPGTTDIDDQIEKGEANLQALRDAASNESDEDIRQRITDLFQREIDALNALYAQQKSDATKAGLAQLGTNRASQARFGLLGSTFGEAETAGINQQTEQQKQDIDVRAQAALAPIYNQISTEILNAQKAKTTARLSSAEDYLANLRAQKDTKANIAANAIRNMLVNSAKPTDKDLDDMAKQIGVDPSTFKSDYKAAVRAEEADIEKATQAAEKAQKEAEKMALDMLKTGADITKPYAAGGYLFQFNSSTGNVEQIGVARSVDGGGGDSGKNYDAKTIPADLKATLMQDVRAKGVTWQELSQAYPSVNTDYIRSLLDK